MKRRIRRAAFRLKAEATKSGSHLEADGTRVGGSLVIMLMLVRDLTPVGGKVTFCSIRRAAAAVLTCGAFVTPAVAQDNRFIISVNGGYQPTTNDFSQTQTFTVYVEQGASTTRYDVPGGPLAEVGVVVRLFSRFGAGVSGGGTRLKSDSTISARIPHPLYFDRHREVSGTSPDLDRTETAVHVSAAFLWPVRDRFLLVLAGGPTLFSVTQEFTSTVRFSEEFPFDTATFTGVDLRKLTERRLGFNAGVDVAYRFGRHFGAGAVVRFSRATVEFDKGTDARVSVDAGGLQTGAGVRILF